MHKSNYHGVGTKRKPWVIITARMRVRGPRSIQLRSTGFHVPGYCVPHPDTSDIVTMFNGAVARMGKDETSPVDPILQPDPVILADFDGYVKTKVMDFKPLPLGLDMSAENWINNLSHNYSEKKKKDLLRVAAELPSTRTLFHKRHGAYFAKAEGMPKMKHSRGICSPEDAIKCRLGAAAHYMEDYVYSNGHGWKVHFIKHVPVWNRPRYILDLLRMVGGGVMATDYSNFECSHSREVMIAGELQVYKRLLLNYPDVYRDFAMICTTNIMRNKQGLTLKIIGRRCSGDMVTSLGNGVVNALLIMYLNDRTEAGLVGAVVEGDDSLMSLPKPLDFTLAIKLGFVVKKVSSDSIGRAGFCGLIFDEEDLVNIVNPFERLASVGWTGSNAKHGGSKVMLELAKANFMSLLAEASRCPVLGAVALCVVCCLHGSVARYVKDWWVDGYILNHKRPGTLDDIREMGVPLGEVPQRTRILFEACYGVTVAEQLRIEQWCKTAFLDGVRPLDGPILELFRSRQRVSSMTRNQVKVRAGEDTECVEALSNFALYWDTYVSWCRKGDQLVYEY